MLSRGTPPHRPLPADPPPSALFVTTPSHESPSACAPFRLTADASVDGTEPPYAAARRDAHAVQCVACRAWLEARQAYRRRLRAIGESLRAPDALRARITALLRGTPRATGP